ncbi:hypothetical protein LINPERHAP1_LOCUS12096 [Linum perenne]
MTTSATDRSNLTTKEEEEELFEIDIGIIPSPHYWEINCSKATVRRSLAGEVALFANCLVPVSDVSSAVPTSCSTAYESVVSSEEQLLLIRLHRRNFELLTFEELLGPINEDVED